MLNDKTPKIRSLRDSLETESVVNVREPCKFGEFKEKVKYSSDIRARDCVHSLESVSSLAIEKI